MRVVVRLDHEREIPEQLLVRNHNGPATLATVYTIRTWLDANPMPDFSDYMFGPTPAIHTPPSYRLVGNPPTKMPAAPENLVATVLGWEVTAPTPNLLPMRNRPPTPYPTTNTQHAPRPLLALPWYGIGGVPALENIPDESADTNRDDVSLENDAAALAGLTMEDPPAFSARGHTEDEHVSRAQK
jgi:hypothetical protein